MTNIHCTVSWCKSNTDNRCTRDNVNISVGDCDSFVPEYHRAVNEMENTIETEVARAINTFRQKSGFSLGGMDIHVEMMETPEIGSLTTREAIVQSVNIDTKVLVNL